jgi:hypothetical protein
MAVYERAYRGYAGGYTAEAWRFLALARHGLQRVFAPRLFAAFYAASFLPAVGLGALIYVSHNAKVLKFMGLNPGDVAIVSSGMFMYFLAFEGKFLGFLMALIVGPALIAPDLLNNALPLYLSRPFNRTEYIAGKLAVLVGLLSSITWVPYLLLYALQAYLAGWEWTKANLNIPGAIFVGSWIWILCISTISLAATATLKSKIWSRVFMFVVLFALAAFGTVLAVGLGLGFGHNLNVFQMNLVVWSAMFDVPIGDETRPLWSAWATLIAACAISTAILYRKVRAYEVVR